MLQVEQAMGVHVFRVGQEKCLNGRSALTECESSCHPSLSISYNLSHPMYETVVANTTGLAFPRLNTSEQCACSTRDFKQPETCRSKPCLNHGSCLDTRHGPV